ncbi:hypothetical protein A0H81_10157 [Grifola frondosa]|uniref:Uncharacterized protein n=1 Tax=Grifola frondosa TaxID=5627 RepID=A0A1C7LYP0_GRIFR|nr:hypothetical protein A0H81_10157 [Grifola frondosa]
MSQPSATVDSDDDGVYPDLPGFHPSSRATSPCTDKTGMPSKRRKVTVEEIEDEEDGWESSSYSDLDPQRFWPLG